MKTKLLIVTSLLALATVPGFGSEPTPPPGQGDSSSVVFENDKVRIILYHTSSGKNLCGFGMHSHPAHAYIQLQPAKFRVTTPDGKEEVLDVPAGDAGWEPAVTHRVETLSPATVDVYLIEIKDKDWKPSTGLHL